MMLVDGEAVEADLIGELHQPDKHFVGFAGLDADRIRCAGGVTHAES